MKEDLRQSQSLTEKTIQAFREQIVRHFKSEVELGSSPSFSYFVIWAATSLISDAQETPHALWRSVYLNAAKDLLFDAMATSHYIPDRAQAGREEVVAKYGYDFFKTS